MTLTWQLCKTYEEARDHSRVIYLHEWDDKPFYWGKAHNSFFGGHKRQLGDLHASGRYNSGYRHWIEGCLRHGAKLYIGKPDAEALLRLDEVEKFLISTYGHEVNTRVPKAVKPLSIEHRGTIPLAIQNAAKRAQPP